MAGSACGPPRPASTGHYQPTLAFLRDALKRSAARRDAQRRLIVVETTTLDIERGEPAIGHVRAALAGGAHVDHRQQGARSRSRIGALAQRGRARRSRASCSKAR